MSVELVENRGEDGRFIEGGDSMNPQVYNLIPNIEEQAGRRGTPFALFLKEEVYKLDFSVKPYYTLDDLVEILNAELGQSWITRTTVYNMIHSKEDLPKYERLYRASLIVKGDVIPQTVVNLLNDTQRLIDR
ncbi:MAG: hypothetical protein Q9M91_01570 [Candidatus Dojkabacteria bacterium]|nr:hypothetical protein [Candidatus Dojkabacteria bacterium]